MASGSTLAAALRMPGSPEAFDAASSAFSMARALVMREGVRQLA